MLKPGVGVDSFVYHARFWHLRGLISTQKPDQARSIGRFPDRQLRVLFFSDYFVFGHIFLLARSVSFGKIKDNWVDLTWRGGHILLNPKGQRTDES